MSLGLQRVCMLTTGYPRFKGDLFGTFVDELAQALARAGVEVEVVAPHEAGLPRSEKMAAVPVRRFSYVWPRRWQRLAYGGGIPTNLQGSWLARLSVPFFLLAFVWGARRSCRRAQIVHCHWSPVGWIGLGAAGGRPVVLSVRGSDINWLEKGLLAPFIRAVYRRVSAVVAVSQAIADKLIGLGVDPQKVQVVPNGVDPRFAPTEKQEPRRNLGLESEAFILLFVGLLVPVKGLDVLLDALALVGSGNWRCILVGDGALRPALQSQARSLGLEDNIVFAGTQSSRQIPQWMNAADMLVLPSRSEGRPNVVLEAQACGVPVLATRVGGTPELVQDGDTGLLVAADDAPGLAGQIQRLMGDEGLRRRLGRRGVESIAERRLTWEASAALMQQVYRQVLERRRQCAA
jgi:teichuronic acid biosynthesis glycosyltransferase TuaC